VAAIVTFVDLARSADRERYRVHDSSLAALAMARQLGTAWGATVYAAVILHDGNMGGDIDSTGRVAVATPLKGVNELKQELARAGADRIVVAITDAPPAPLWSAFGIAWSGVLDHLRPRLVLFGADAPATLELAPRTGARIGARLLHRATTSGQADEIELRDREGARVRASDSGASVATIVGRAPAAHTTELATEIVVLSLPGMDARIEHAGAQPAELVPGSTVVVALGDDALEPEVVASARRLADLLGATLIGGPAAMKAGAIAANAVVDRCAPLAPELAIVVGNLGIDFAGATSIVRIGVDISGKGIDGLLPPPITNGLDELVRLLGA